MSSASSDPALTLYMFEGSNACLTATLMLHHKELPYRSVRLPPAFHAVAVRALGFPERTVPALKVDHRRVQGTRAIARHLDALQASPPLLPADASLRHSVEQAEKRGEELQNATRRLFYWAARRESSVFTDLIAPGFGRRTAGLLRGAAPVLIRVASLAHRATGRTVQDDLAGLPERLDEIDAWIRDGTLGGESLNAADFQIAANTRGLLAFDDLAPALEGRPLARHARRVAPSYSTVVGPVFPREWVEPLWAANPSRVGGTHDGLPTGSGASRSTSTTRRMRAPG